MRPQDPATRARWAKRLAILAACLLALVWCLLLLTGLLHSRCFAAAGPPAQQEVTCSRAILLGKLFHNRADNPEFARAYFQRGIALAELDRPTEATRDFQDTLRLLGVERGFDATQDLATAKESVQTLFAIAQALDPTGKAYATWAQVLLKTQ